MHDSCAHDVYTRLHEFSVLQMRGRKRRRGLMKVRGMRLKCEAAQANRLSQTLQEHRQTVYTFSAVAKMFKAAPIVENDAC